MTKTYTVAQLYPSTQNAISRQPCDRTFYTEIYPVVWEISCYNSDIL